MHLGDTLGDDDRYRVIHKLGSGGTSIVWLCRDVRADTPTYVALKILMADLSTEDCPELVHGQSLQNCQEKDGSEAICLFRDHFRFDGPNGSHLCFVYPVLGPKVSSGLLYPSDDPDKTLRDICRAMVRSMDFLHRQGLCHGGSLRCCVPGSLLVVDKVHTSQNLRANKFAADFTPKNVLQGISGLDGRSEDKLLETLGEPRKVALETRESHEPHTLRTAPQYAVYPVKWGWVDTSYFTNEPFINDFGQTFKTSDPPEDTGIPFPYQAPELFLHPDGSKSGGAAPGLGSDLWALGCTLFEVRTGRKLFSLYEDDDDEYLDSMVRVLGRMPEPWWSTTWEYRKKLWTDETDDLGRPIPVGAPLSSSITATIHPSVAYGTRSLTEVLEAGVWYIETRGLGGNQHRDISDEEKVLFADLLGRLLKWQPQDRMSARDALGHEWFKMPAVSKGKDGPADGPEV